MSFTVFHSLSFSSTVQGRHPPEALPNSAHITVHYTLTIENKTKKLERSARLSFDFSRGVDNGYANYISVSDITEESGFVFDDKIRIRVELRRV